MKPHHVRAWEDAQRYSARRHWPNEEACDRLIDQWLLSTTWKIEAFGRSWEGSLSEINDSCDVFFTLKVTDPDDPNKTIAITAPFEQFVPTGQTDPVRKSHARYPQKGKAKGE